MVSNGQMTVSSPRTSKIVIVSSYPFEDTNAAKARISSFRAALDPVGQVFILCKRGRRDSADPGIVTLGSAAGAPRNFLLRGLSELIFSLRLVGRMRLMKPDLVIVTVPSLFLLVFGYLVRLRLIFDIRDLVWSYLPERSSLDRLFKRILTGWSLSVLRRVPALTVTNPSEKAHLQTVLGPDTNIAVVANGLARDRFDTLCTHLGPASVRSGPRNVLYVGNVGLAQDLETLVRAARQQPKFRFTVIGTGNDLPRLRTLVADLEVTNVEFVGGMSWSRLLDQYQKADALYAQIGVEYHTAVPSKLSEYMVVGRPVIFGGFGASRDWLERFSGVAVIPPSDPAALVEALDQLDVLAASLDTAANRRLIETRYLRDDQAQTMADLVRRQLNVNGEGSGRV